MSTITKNFLTLISACLISLSLFSQEVSLSIDMGTNQAGTLYERPEFDSTPAGTVTNFTLSGDINALDISFIRNNMNALTSLDMRGTTIAERTFPASGFYGFSSLETVVLPNNIITIGERAFEKCENLGSINLPDSLYKIDKNAFANCNSLARITFPTRNLNALENSAFENCATLDSVIVPGNIRTIRDKVFTGCNSLNTITLNNGINLLGQESFAQCSSLETIVIPNSVTSIGNRAFSNCTLLKNITLPNNIKTIRTSLFDGCTSLESVELPQYVLSIGDAAFANCIALQTINLPDTISSIGKRAFMNCILIDSINIPLKSTQIDDYTFYNCRNLKTINIHDNIISIGNSSFANCVSLEEFKPIEHLTLVRDSAFFNCINLKEVQFSDNLISIENGVFQNCPAITSIELPSKVNNIGSYAFAGCSSISSIKLSENIEDINEYTFFDCSSLPAIELPIYLSRIANNAFQNCSSLKKIEVPQNIDSLPEYVFYNCSSLETIFLPEVLDTISQYCFAQCIGLKEITYLNKIAPFPPENIFEGVKKDSCILRVPTESDTSYSSVFNPAWRDFNVQLSGFIVHAYSENIGEGKVTGSNLYKETQYITLEATPSYGYLFFDWTSSTGDSISNANPYKFKTNKDTVLRANFIPDTFTVTLIINNKEYGSVIGLDSNGIGNFPYLASVALDSRSNAGYKLGSWTIGDSVVSTSASYSFDITQDVIITANFIEDTDVSIKEPAGLKETINIYPNPTQSGFYITGIDKSTSFSLFSSNAQLILKKKVIDGEYISIDALPNGVYIALIETLNGLITKKIIKY